jgi:hypothetical protein
MKSFDEVPREDTHWEGIAEVIRAMYEGVKTTMLSGLRGVKVEEGG